MHFLKIFHFHPTKVEFGLLGTHAWNHTILMLKLPRFSLKGKQMAVGMHSCDRSCHVFRRACKLLGSSVQGCPVAPASVPLICVLMYSCDLCLFLLLVFVLCCHCQFEAMVKRSFCFLFSACPYKANVRNADACSIVWSVDRFLELGDGPVLRRLWTATPLHLPPPPPSTPTSPN